MKEFDYHQIDDVIHSRIRLAIMSVLISIDEADFIFLREKVKTTDGNLSTHLKKLEDAGYVAVNKSFVNRKPISRYMLTQKGRKAFEIYVEHLENLIKKK
ncbi:MAG TPA: transcriptional regulator [Ignavibacteria bacterium]|nr:transcriptional regulator [Ignavibacteria bacterium]